MEKKLYIIMGCFGRRDDDFISCAGVENPILEVESNLYQYEEMMAYLDLCRLFDKPMFDYNSLRHFIFNLREKFDQPMKRLWSEKKFELYQKFIIDHRHCGLYIKLASLSKDNLILPNEKKILIPAENKQEKIQIKPQILTRNRRAN